MAMRRRELALLSFWECSCLEMFYRRRTQVFPGNKIPDTHSHTRVMSSDKEPSQLFVGDGATERVLESAQLATTSTTFSNTPESKTATLESTYTDTTPVSNTVELATAPESMSLDAESSKPSSTAEHSAAVQSEQITTASARFWNIAELFRETLSYLPVPDLIAAGQVNTTFQDNILGWPAARRMLFLTLNGEPPQTCHSTIGRYGHTHAHDAFSSFGKHETVRGTSTLPLVQVATCPLLRFITSNSALCNREVFHKWTPGLAYFTMQPFGLGKLGDMFLTDPPFNEVRVRLMYVHTPGSAVTIVTSCIVTNEGLLTLNQLLDKTVNMIGHSWMEERLVDFPKTPAKVSGMNGKSAKAEMREQVKKRGGKFELDLELSMLVFNYYAIHKLKERAGGIRARARQRGNIARVG